MAVLQGGLTALHIACYQGMIDFIKHVIPPLARQRERRIDINVKDNVSFGLFFLDISLIVYILFRHELTHMAMGTICTHRNSQQQTTI